MRSHARYVLIVIMGLSLGACRQADGPDQVHMMALGKQVIERYSNAD